MMVEISLSAAVQEPLTARLPAGVLQGVAGEGQRRGLGGLAEHRQQPFAPLALGRVLGCGDQIPQIGLNFGYEILLG